MLVSRPASATVPAADVNSESLIKNMKAGERGGGEEKDEIGGSAKRKEEICVQPQGSRAEQEGEMTIRFSSVHSLFWWICFEQLLIKAFDSMKSKS